MNSMTKLLLGCISSLEKRSGISDVKFLPGPSVNKHELDQWEQNTACILPEDLKAFYRTMDGLTLRWSAKICDGVIQVGRMEISKLENLCKVQFSTDKEVLSVLDGMFVDDDGTNEVPKFDTRSRIYELDHCDGYGKVCLVYMNTRPGVPATDCHIWFLDRSFSWHYIADSFTIYYRLMVAHLGLPQWQYSFTDVGISPQMKQWFNVYAPLRMEMMSDSNSRPAALDSSEPATSVSGSDISIPCTIDTLRVFKGKLEKKKLNVVSNAPAGAGQKKKSPTNTSQAAAKPAPNAQRNSASSQQSLSSKSRS